MKRRIGTFELPISYDETLGYATLAMVFDGFIPLHMDVQHHRKRVVFTGIHATFDAICEGTVPPEYRPYITVNLKQNDKGECTFRRLSEPFA